MQFIADVMLGKLARWLRILGYDVAYSNKFSDDAIVRTALSENRVILTRDVQLARRKTVRKALLIESQTLDDQIREVVREFRLPPPKPLTRCIQCNLLLTSIDKNEIFNSVPPFVYLAHDRFAICPNCHRVYWAGTHSDHIRGRIASWFHRANE